MRLRAIAKLFSAPGLSTHEVVPLLVHAVPPAGERAHVRAELTNAAEPVFVITVKTIFVVEGQATSLNTTRLLK